LLGQTDRREPGARAGIRHGLADLDLAIGHPGAFSAAAAIAIAPLKSKQPNKIRNTARLLSPSIWPVALPRRHAARFDLGATCRWVRIRRARRTRPQSLGQECKSVATFQRFLIATARLAVDPERIRAVVNLRYAVLSSECIAVVADASSKGSRRPCDDNDRQSQ